MQTEKKANTVKGMVAVNVVHSNTVKETSRYSTTLDTNMLSETYGRTQPIQIAIKTTTLPRYIYTKPLQISHKRQKRISLTFHVLSLSTNTSPEIHIPQIHIPPHHTPWTVYRLFDPHSTFSTFSRTH